MKPSIYLYNDTEKGFELYLGECSTLEGLSLLNKQAQISTVTFGATLYKNHSWATEHDVPSFEDVSAVVEFLESEGDIGLVDFEILIAESGSLSTHDDSECHFIMKSKHHCIELLKVALPPQYREILINKLINNNGLYFTCSDEGIIHKYGSFDEYVSKNS